MKKIKRTAAVVVAGLVVGRWVAVVVGGWFLVWLSFDWFLHPYCHLLMPSMFEVIGLVLTSVLIGLWIAGMFEACRGKG